MQEKIEERLKKMIVERLFLKIAPEDIEDDKSLVDTYGVDSVSLLEMVVGIEEEFGVAVDDDDFSIEHFETVSALSTFVRGKLDGDTAGGPCHVPRIKEEHLTIGEHGLAGSLHRPATDASAAVLVCNPLFEERKSAHRVLVDAARALCLDGAAVLRFDYRGCGDSPGRLPDYSVEDWLEDAASARQTLTAMFPSTPLVLLGLRLGGTFAALNSARAPCAALVLWEPVVDGARHLRQERQRALIKQMMTFGRRRDAEAPVNGQGEARHADLGGYALAPRLAQDINSLDLTCTAAARCRSAFLVHIGQEKSGEDDAQRLSDALQGCAVRVTTQSLRIPPFWNLLGLADADSLIETTTRWIRERDSESPGEEARGNAGHME